MHTALSQQQLVELRSAGIEAQRADGAFVDPHLAYGVIEILRRRGEAWATDVLGRDLSRRSLLRNDVPWLRDGELHTLWAADVEEDRAITDAMEESL